MPFRDDDRQDLDPREFPEPDDVEVDRMPCPHCLAVIFDDSVRCPACGRYLADDDSSRRPWWVILGALLCLAVSLYWILP
jgi:hypothetical protein